MRIITFGFLIILGFVISELHAQGAYFDNRYPPSPGRRSNNLTHRSRSRPQYGYRRGVRFQSAPREDDGQVQQLTDSPNSVNGINGGSNTVGGGVNGNGVRPDQQLREGDLDTTTVPTGLGDGSSSFSPSSSLSPGVSSDSDEPSAGSYAGDGSPISTPTSTGLVDDAEPNDVTPNVQSGIGEQGPIDNEADSQGPSSGPYGSNRPGVNNGINQQNNPGSTSSGYPTGTTPSGYSGSNGNGGVKRPVNGNGSRTPGVGTNGNGVGYSSGVNNGMNGGSSVTYSNGGSPGATSGNRMGRGPLNGNGISMNGNGGSRVNGQGSTNGNRNGNNYPGTNGVVSGTGFPSTTTNGYSGNGVSNGVDSGLPGMTNVVDSTGSGINGVSGVSSKPTSGVEGTGVSGYSGGPSDGSISGGHGDDGSYSHDSGHHRSGNPIDWLRDAIRGEPGRDYPIFYSVPNTPFKCNDVGYPGYYADVDAQCQVFHICQMDGRKDSFLCPNGTVFSQRNFVCVWWYDFDCNEAPALYNLNEKLYKDAEGVPITGSGASSGTGPVMNPAGRSLDDGQTVGSGGDNGIVGPSSSPAPSSGSGSNSDSGYGQRTPGTSVSEGSIDKPSQSGGADDANNVNGEAGIDSVEPGMSPMDGVGPMTSSDGGQVAGPAAGPMADDGVIPDMGQDDDAGRSEGSMGNSDDSARLPGSSDEGVTDSSIQNKEDGVEENDGIDGQPETVTDNVGPYSADGGALDQSGMGGVPGSTKGPLSPSTPTSVSSSGIDNTMGSDGESGVTSGSGSGEGGATAAGAAAGAGVGPIDETAPSTGTNVAGYGSVKGVSPSAASRYRLANRRSSPARVSRTRGSRTSTRGSTRSRSRSVSRSSSRQRAASPRSNSQRSARKVNRVARVSRGRANNRSQLRNRSYARRRTTRYRNNNRAQN